MAGVEFYNKRVRIKSKIRKNLKNEAYLELLKDKIGKYLFFWWIPLLLCNPAGLNSGWLGGSTCRL
jgi:hypothetical protein